MKKFTFLFALVLLVLFNCHESKDAINENQIAPLNRNVGKKISMEEAQRWINRFKENDNSSRAQNDPNVMEGSLHQLLDPIEDKLGVSFHRSIDENGGYHILVAPVQEGKSVWDREFVLDASTGEYISSQPARAWADRYKAENPSGVWSHFFGIHVFSAEYISVDVVDAVNDQEVQQLLLIMWRESGTGNDSGRTNGAEPDVYDHSVGCPPSCGIW